MQLFYLTLFLLIAKCFYASDFLGSKYNLLSINYSYISEEDFKATETGYDINCRPGNLDFFISYGSKDRDFDEVLGIDTSAAKIETEINTVGLGFLFRQSDLDIIPSLKFGTGGVSVFNTEISDIDYAEIALTFRVLANENLAVSFSLHHINYGSLLISENSLAKINNDLNSLDISQLSQSQLESIEINELEDTDVIAIKFDQNLGTNLIATYGISMDNVFDKASKPNFSFQLGYSF